MVIFIYIDINDSITLSKYGELADRKDYKYVRARIQDLYDPEQWDSYTNSQKKVFISWFVEQDSARQMEFFTPTELMEMGIEFHIKSTQSREIRMNYTVGLVFSRLEWGDANDVIDDMDKVYEKANGDKYCWNLWRKYLKNGREGTEEGDPEGLFDYIEAREGTRWNGNGLIKKSYKPKYGTLTDLSIGLIQILKYGNY